MGGDDLNAQTLLAGEPSSRGRGQRVGQELQEGDILGSYQLERLLGEGSMGRVFQARHVRLGRQVALKVLRPEHARDGAFVQRFFREAQSVNRINHEHIVEIFDFVEDAEAGHVYCVMELLRGQSLSQVLREERLTLERIQRIAVQVCAALGAAHQLGVVHRDVKPDNLFIIQRGGQPDFVKVLDFGVAKILTSEGTHGTLDGTIIGTPAYMAPEQAAGLPVDVQADIYAVGNLLYEMLAGQPPFLAPNFGQLVVQIITKAPPALPATLSSGEPLPAALGELVRRCLAKEPERRPQSLAEVTTALLLLDKAPAEDAESLRPTARMTPVARGLWQQLRAPWVVGGMALAVLSGALTWRGMEPVLSEYRAEAVRVAEATPPAVTLTVHSFPEGAQVVRADTGEMLGVTPLVKELPRADKPVGLRVELAGYVPLEREVRLDSHAVLELLLAKAQQGRTVAPASREGGRRAGARDAVIDPFAK
jgi:serine/threonine-protein kinase